MENGGHNYKFSNRTGHLSSPHLTPLMHYQHAVDEVLVRYFELAYFIYEVLSRLTSSQLHS